MEFTEVFEELREYARIIRNEKTTSANTALRIGDMYLSIIDAMEQVSKRNELFSLRTDGNGSQYIHTPYALASDSTLSSLGVGSDSGGGGISYDRLDSWDNYVEGDGSVLSSYLGYGLLQRIEQLEDGASGDFADIEDKVDKNTQSITALSTSLNDFLTGVDVDDTINRWKELETFLAGYTETATLADLLGVKADKSVVEALTVTVSSNYTTLDGLITAEKNRAVAAEGALSGRITTNAKNIETNRGNIAKNTKDIADIFATLADWFTLEDGVLHSKYGLASDSTVSSLGVGTDGTGGVSYDRLDSWNSYTDDKAGYVLSAALGWDLKTRLDNLDIGDFLSGYYDKGEVNDLLTGKQDVISDLGTIKRGAALGATALQHSDLDEYVNEITTSGSGNAITSVTKSGKKLTFNKASSFFLTESFTKSNIKTTLGISDWALASSKPSYKTSEVAEDSNLYFTTDRVKNYLTGAVSSVLTSDLTASRALISNASGKISVSAVTSTELGYLDGVTSAIQTQLNALSSRIKAYEDILKIEENGTLLHATVALASDSTLSSLGVGSDGGSSGGSVDWSAVPTNIIPASNGIYNLGNASLQWGKLYVSRIENSDNDLYLNSSGYIRMLTDVVFGNNDNYYISPTGTAYLGNIYSNGNIVATSDAVDSKLNGYYTKRESDNKYLYKGYDGATFEINSDFKIASAINSLLKLENKVNNDVRIAFIGNGTILGYIGMNGSSPVFIDPEGGKHIIALKDDNVNVDLSNYYTKAETNSAISSAINKLDFATGDEVLDMLSNYITTGDLSSELSFYQPLIDSNNKIPYSLISGTPSLATVATSGNYNDLSNKPNIPSLSGYATQTWVNSNFATTSAFTALNNSFTNLNYYLTANGSVGQVLTKKSGGYEWKSFTVDWSNVSSKPTTLGKYGITDGMKFEDHGYNYVAASFMNATLSKKAVDYFIECWDSDGWWNWKAGKWITVGGTSSHFVKGDGSLDSTAYLPLSGGTLSGALTISGKVLIGTTTDNGYKLNVNGNANIAGGVTTDRVHIAQTTDVARGMATSFTDTSNDSAGIARPWYGLSFVQGDTYEQTYLSGYFGLTIRTGGTPYYCVIKGGGIRPWSNGTQNLGTTEFAWANVVAVNGIYSGSLTVSRNITMGGNTVATQSWVNSQNYVAPEGADIEFARNITIGSGGTFPLTVKGVSGQAFIRFISGTTQLGYLGYSGANAPSWITADGTQTLPLATQTWVNSNFATTSALSGYLPKSGGMINGNLSISDANGNPTAHLSVGGSATVYGSITITMGGLTAANGTVSAKALTQTSDERLKSLMGDVRLSLGAMACAPLKKFHYHDDGLLRVGTLAQYWQGALPEVVSTTPNGTLALAYGELGVAMGISLANHLTELKADLSVTDDEVTKLKKRVEQLENENKRLQERVDALAA